MRGPFYRCIRLLHVEESMFFCDVACNILHRHNQVSISFGSMSEFLPDSSSEVDMTFIRSSEETVSDIQRTCKVCGDRANGYNFGVLTCESCKAFSRRNAVREENIKCPFSNSCDITSASRRFCQGCRLRKCFEVDMRKSWLESQKLRVGTRKRNYFRNETTNLNEEVSVSKAHLDELIRKSKRPPLVCECSCTCGFYPPNTRLTTIESNKLFNTQALHSAIVIFCKISIKNSFFGKNLLRIIKQDFSSC